jgi:hypothetical protein
MMRQTSLLSWAELQRTGVINQRQREVLDALKKSKRPVTGRELEQYMMLNGMDGLGSWKRLSELREKKLVKEHPKARCSVTGRMAIRWEALE